MIHIGKYFAYIFHGVARIPTFLIKINKYNKNKDKYDLVTRYDYTRVKIDDVLTNMLRVNLQVYGLENVDQKETYLITPNHQGMLDPLTMIHIFERPCLMVSKKEIKKMPVIGKIVKMIDGFFLDRENPRDALRMVKTCKEALTNNTSVVIFPEGTRSKSENHPLGEYKSGAFKCVYGTGKRILPVVIDRSYIPLNCKYKNDGSIIKISFLKPIGSEIYENMNTTQLSEYIKNLANAELINLRK